jgi:hypothetical protein
MAYSFQYDTHPIHGITIEEGRFTSIDGTFFSPPQLKSHSKRTEFPVYGKITRVPTKHRLAPYPNPTRESAGHADNLSRALVDG